MTDRYSNQTADMSASTLTSSISVDVYEELTSLDSGKSPVLKGDLNNGYNAEVPSAIKSVFVMLYNKKDYKTILEIAETLTLQGEYEGSVFFNNLLAEVYSKTFDEEEAIKHYKKALLIEPGLEKTHNNLGISYKNMGFLDNAETHLKQAVAIKPDFAQAYNNLGNVLNEKSDLPGARSSYLRSIELDPERPHAYWNLHSTVNDMELAKSIIELCLDKDPQYEPAIYTLAAINAYQGDRSISKLLFDSEVGSEASVRSLEWILALPQLPQLSFNRWNVFDKAVSLSNTDRAFYEFGVWMGESFKYLSKHFSKSFGFDTFEGLPENWHNVPSGTYSSYGSIPEIENAEFIEGEFKDTLPTFFEFERPTAGLINFDADLYSSTKCALENSIPVIDNDTILVFDELIVNETWEKDEFKALEEFCSEHDMNYSVKVVSLFTKQAVVKISRKPLIYK